MADTTLPLWLYKWPMRFLPLLFALSLAPTLLPLQGAAMGMDGITQGAAPLLRRSALLTATLALGYALLPFQGGSSSRTSLTDFGKPK